MKFRATILGLLGAVTALAGVTAHAQSMGEGTSAEQVWLDAHNEQRAQFGTAPLTWNGELAREAEQWAQRLARENRLRHSSRDERNNAGENLWMGSAGYFSPASMIAAFSAEKQYFRPGTFPHVSSTGNTADVGHYTQIVWARTREVGCATARGGRFDVLVCRYWPAGNVIGTRIEPQRQLAQR